MEIILVLLIVAVLNGAVTFIDSMLADLVPMTLHADQYMTAAGGVAWWTCCLKSCWGSVCR